MSCKKILFSFVLIAVTLLSYSQQKMNNYAQSWKKIDSLIEKAGLAQSALKEVDAIYTAAKKEGNDAQVIKSLLYKLTLNEELTDDTRYENIALLEKETAAAKEPVRSILNSITAGIYWGFLQQNRWRFYNRTATVNFKKEDLATWTIDDLNEKISSLFLASLQNSEVLKKTSLQQFDAIIIKGNTRPLRSTLYDLLAHRALDYFKNDERGISKPAYAFEIDDSIAFADAGEFANHTFKTNDSLSLHHKALTIFQELISFHLNDKKPDALIDVDVERIEFVNNYGTRPAKDNLYRQALERIIARYPGNAVATDAIYLLAEWHAGKARTYDPLRDTTNRYAYLAAIALCEKALAISGKSQGKSNCANLLHQIRARQVSTQAEKVNSVNQPFRVLINYRNFTTGHFRLIKLDKPIKEKLGNNQWEDKFWSQLVTLTALKTFSQNFPDTKDHQSHRVEMKIDALPVGEYALLASADKGFSLKSNALALQMIYVSDIAYVNNERKYYVVNRNTGDALPLASIQVWQAQYDYNQRRNILSKLETYKADNKGFFELNEIKRKNGNDNYRLDISYKNDRLFLDDDQYSYVYNEYPETSQKDQTFLFTDRSIYRPGQIIYFKGIVVTPKTKTSPSAIVIGRKAFVKLFNANDELVDSVDVTTNDFGSYSGKFTLPSGILNGDFAIRDGSNQNETRIKVEEYKRPKFFVEIPKPSGSYRLEDTVAVEAIAKSYAGNNINGAAVNYRVVRRTIMPLWVRSDYLPRIWPPYPSSNLEVAHGTGTTDEHGKFIISFKAIPDKSVSSKYNPVFYYEVTVDVTDLNGETRSGSSSIAVGYHALQLQLDVPGQLHVDSLKQLKISSVNMNDVFEKADVNISIYKLTQPSRKFRERYWPQPDQYILSREEYYKNFPYDLYSDENDITKWTREKKVLDKTITTAPNGTYGLNNTKFQSGWYAIDLITKDKYGVEVKEFRYIELKDPKMETPAKYADKGELPASRVYVKNNRVHIEKVDVKTPASEKELDISYTTFRDKTLPGTNETWKVKITGYKGERAAAELLTAMYDASLDQFNPHLWTVPHLWSSALDYSQWTAANNFIALGSEERVFDEPWEDVVRKEYDRLKTLDVSVRRETKVQYSMRPQAGAPPRAEAAAADMSNQKKVQNFAEENETSAPLPTPAPSIQPRSNLNETAFFFPDLRTDSVGNIEFSFTTPQALTEWKWMLFAHTKELAFGYGQKNMVTQKELMVQPNAPRFLREGDRIDFSAKIVNMTAQEITGNAFLQLTDPTTGEPADGIFQNISPKQFFTAAAGQSIPVNFTLTIPFNFVRPVIWRIIASSRNLSDGEESLVPVITNRMLVTETMPLPIKGNTTKTFTFDKLLKSGDSESLQQHGITVEFTSNPAWYAIQALPYLQEGAKENAEQIFNRYYANAIASKIANTSQRFREIIDKWSKSDTSALPGNLQKNEELKSIILQETPWVLEAKTESQQKRNLALLFDMTRMAAESNAAFDKLQQMQSPNGGFIWCPGGRDDRYMTQYILSGIGHLKQLGALPDHEKLNLLIKAGISYIDQQIRSDYEQLKKTNKKLPEGIISSIPVQYLYMRSFFSDIPVPGEVFPAYNYFRNQAKQTWVKHNSYMKGMIALSLFRTGDVQNAKKIMASLKETSINNPELGMYWKDMSGGYYWHQAPVEAQSVLIEAFAEIVKDNAPVNNMKTWLLKNKQTNSWNTTKSTADACYALLLQGSDWTMAEPDVTIKLGTTTISSGGQKTEAGTGYFKTAIAGEKVKPGMGNISVKVSSNNTGVSSWGGIYWQYFENLDNITSAATPLKLEKKLFVERNTDRGPVIEPLAENSELHVGDKVKVRIELRADRDMEYIHMKDMRGSCMEPVNVISQYKWNGGLGYYESTKDASTDFFFDVLPKGAYVFEYPLFVTHTGTFSNGVTTIQCMYAPEFSSHSEGIKVNVEKK